jgi:hypothetical protein
VSGERVSDLLIGLGRRMLVDHRGPHAVVAPLSSACTYAKLDGMHDATNFWLLAGTAAPVIALANVVLFGDTVKLMLDFRSIRKRSTATAEQKKWAEKGYKFAVASAAMSYLNMFAQTITLFYALLYFLIGKSGIPGKIAEIILTAGMAILAGGLMFSSIARNSASEIRWATPSEEHPDQPASP